MLKQLFISVVLAAPVRLPDLADGSYGGVASANPRALAASTNPSALVVSGSNSSSTPSSGMRLRLDCSLGCQGGFKPTPTRFVAASDCMSDEWLPRDLGAHHSYEAHILDLYEEVPDTVVSVFVLGAYQADTGRLWDSRVR